MTIDCTEMKKLTHMKQTDGQENKEKILKNPTLSVVNPGPSDPDCLYYPLNVEGVTQKCSLLPAHKR